MQFLALLGYAVMALTLSSAPAAEPLSRADAKTHLRVDSTDEDDYVDALIVAAREEGERRSWRQFITATWQLTLDRFPKGNRPIHVPRPPLQSVSSIVYDDENGDAQTLAAAKYRVDTESEPGRITPVFEEVWPAARPQTGAVRITFVAGYGDSAADVPNPTVHWIRLHVGHWFRHREAAQEGNLQILPFTEGLLDPVRDERIARFAES